MQNLTDLEVDLLLLFYTFSDQYGKVDMPLVREWCKSKMGLILPAKQIYVEQKHLDALVSKGVMPDIDSALLNMRTAPPRKRKPKKSAG